MNGDFAVYQIVIFSISFLLIFRTLIRFIKRKKTIRELFVSVIIWGTLGIIGLYPNLTNILAKLTGFELGINALLTITTLFLLYNSLKQIVINDKLENTITKVVRYDALRELRKD